MHIESNTIQETLVIPLWGRKYCSDIYPELYKDPMAEKIMENLDYDFSVLEQKKSSTMFRFGYLEAAARYTDLATEIKEYIGQLQSFGGDDLRTSALYNVEELSCAELLEEFMFMGLRRSEGASLAEARERFDVDVLQRFASELAPLFEQKLIAYDASTQRLRLTERGMEVGNQIFEVFVIS